MTYVTQNTVSVAILCVYATRDVFGLFYFSFENASLQVYSLFNKVSLISLGTELIAIYFVI